MVTAQFPDGIYILSEGGTLELPITINGTSAVTLFMSVLTEDGSAKGSHSIIEVHDRSTFFF